MAPQGVNTALFSMDRKLSFHLDLRRSLFMN